VCVCVCVCVCACVCVCVCACVHVRVSALRVSACESMCMHARKCVVGTAGAGACLAATTLVAGAILYMHSNEPLTPHLLREGQGLLPVQAQDGDHHMG